MEKNPAVLQALKEKWRREQLELKKRLIMRDDVDWEVRPSQEGTSAGKKKLELIGGVDISFVNDPNSNEACSSLVVLSYPELQVLYEDYQMVTLTQPYIAGYLAFREADHILELIDRLKRNRPEMIPQVIMVDGNGILHSRGFGVASHLGVLSGIPTIGVAKNYFVVDGVSEQYIREKSRRGLLRGGDFFTIEGQSGMIWGAAVRSLDSAKNPVFVSIGHRVNLETAIRVVLLTSNFRVPEPIRQADLRSRRMIQAYMNSRGTPQNFAEPDED